MPPSDPKRQAIIDAIVARLAAITAGATYFFTPEVGVDYRHHSEITKFPYYGVIEGDEMNDFLAMTPQIKTTLSVSIVGWVSDAEDRRKALNRAVADVQRAIVSDDTWGGIAFETRPLSVITDEATLFAKPFAYFEINIQVVWHHDHQTI
jgi:hypothetical protein